jgi:hypothetical protein
MKEKERREKKEERLEWAKVERREKGLERDIEGWMREAWKQV